MATKVIVSEKPNAVFTDSAEILGRLTKAKRTEYLKRCLLEVREIGNDLSVAITFTNTFGSLPKVSGLQRCRTRMAWMPVSETHVVAKAKRLPHSSLIRNDSMCVISSVRSTCPVHKVHILIFTKNERLIFQATKKPEGFV